MIGRVYLVGAGPGDPGLLTLRGQRCLAEADVVVHDELVPRRLLDHARPDAEVLSPGPAHAAVPRLDQRGIEALLVDRARAGKVVVRLKNGDPGVFGRVGEEALALRAAGVPFEVVPGVTSAFAVPIYAGIPVTHRDHASLVTIVTGHLACPDEGVPPLPFDALARLGGTLVFLMGVRRLRVILEQLVAHGMPGDTPAAMVEHGTTAAQRTIVATLATLADRAVAIGSPAVVVVGDVVRLREVCAWWESRPLAGRRIVVTRPRTQAAALARALEDGGAEVVLFPTIAIVPPADPGVLDRAVGAAGSYDWIVFTSANGVRSFFERLGALARDVRELATARIAAIGPETAAELERRHLLPAVVPPEFRAEGLLAVLGDADVQGRRILLPRAAGAREILPETLRARGAVVNEVEAYRAVPPPDADVAGLTAALEADAIDAITFTSSSTVRNFVALVGEEVVRRCMRRGRPAVACIGPVTAATARELGLAVDVEPTAYTAEALAAALSAHLCAAGGDRLSEQTR